MDAEHAARVFTRGAGFAAEAGGVTGVTERQVAVVQDLGAVHRSERDLGRSDEEELISFDRIDVHLVGREEPGPVHGLRTNEDRRQDWREAAAREPVESEPVERELEQRNVAGAKCEARARDLRAALEVDARTGELEVVLDGKVERRWLAPAADLDSVLLGEPVRRVSVGRIRNPVEQLLASAFGRSQLLLEALQFLFDLFQFLQLLRRRLALELSCRAELLDS